MTWMISSRISAGNCIVNDGSLSSCLRYSLGCFYIGDFVDVQFVSHGLGLDPGTSSLVMPTITTWDDRFPTYSTQDDVDVRQLNIYQPSIY